MNNFCYGVCNLSIVPVRTLPADTSELCTQLLFGEAYTVIEISENTKWLKIKILYDSYEGWIDAIQHNEVSDIYFESYILTNHRFCFDDVAMVESHKETSLIHFGCVLPFLQGYNFKIGNKNYIFEGDIAMPTSDNSFDDNLLFIAFRFVNTPYLWGGKTRFGIDCSGFTQQVYKLLGFAIYRDAYQQATQGQKILSIEETKIGDLLFFENLNHKIIHVGINVGNKKIIHAHGKVRIDTFDSTGILNTETKKYSHQLACIRRFNL